MRTFFLTLLLCSSILAPPLRQELQSLIRQLTRADSTAEGIAALEAIAARYDPEQEDASAVTAGVAKGLALDDVEVRLRTIELLQADMDPEESLRGLLSAAEGYAKDRKALVKRANEAGGLPVLTDETTFGDLRESINALNATVARIERITDYHHALVAALDARDDPRVVEGLGAMLAVQPTGERADTAIDALLRRASGDALAHVVDAIRSFEDTHKERGKEQRRLAKQKPKSKPKGWRGTKDAWKNAEWARIEGAIEQHEQESQEFESWGAALRLRIATCAASHDLPPPPKEILPHRNWASWLRKAFQDG